MLLLGRLKGEKGDFFFKSKYKKNNNTKNIKKDLKNHSPFPPYAIRKYYPDKGKVLSLKSGQTRESLTMPGQKRNRLKKDLCN